MKELKIIIFHRGVFVYRSDHITSNCSKHGMITIVFSAMAVEAFIYDYAAQELGDTFVKKYLDKLTPVSRCVVIPQLITGKQFPRNSQAFNLLKSLIRDRNALVHHKSSVYPSSRFLQEKFERSDQISQRAKDAISTLEALAQELQSIDPNSTAFLLRPDIYRL